MDGDDDIVAMAGERFVDGVVDDLEYHVVQAGAIGRIADVHARALPYCFQTLKLLNARFVVGRYRVALCHWVLFPVRVKCASA